MIEALTVKGSFRGFSGHDRHVREFARGMSQHGVQLQLVDFSNWAPGKLPGEKYEFWFDTLGRPVDSKMVLHFCMPQQVQMAGGKMNINFTMFEATRIPPKWVKLNSQHDLVILPTSACEQAWVESGFAPEKIRLCPLGVNPDLFHPDAEPMEPVNENGNGFHEYGVRFLNVSDLTPRKNLLSLLQVWLRATSREDDAVLVIKLSCGIEERLSQFLNDIKKMEARIGKTRKAAAPIVLLVNRFFSDAEMPGLYAAATHYWSMSRGEGWDLPMMEAGATGLHVIAPYHTAYATYLDDSVAQMVPAQIVPAKFKMSDGTHKLFRKAGWWHPDEERAAELIRQAIDHPRQGRNDALRERIVREFTWRKATARLLEILNELESNGSRNRPGRNRFFQSLWS